MKQLSSLLAAAFVFVCAGQLHAQMVPLQLELHGGAAFPRGDWNEGDPFGTGWGYGGSLLYLPVPFLGLYVGYDRLNFSLDDDGSLDGVDVKFTDAGLRFGAEASVPLPVASPFVAGGFYWGQTEFEITEDDPVFGGTTTTRFSGDSDLGYEAAAGVLIPAGPLLIRTSLGYRTRSTSFGVISEGDEDTTVSYLHFTVGLAITP